jgi:hypothetical protein
MSDLVKRLRDAVSGEHDMTPHGADCLQAADRIEELEAKLAKLVQAAKPLAEMADRYDPPEGDDDLECWSGLATPRIKHLRALRTTLAELKGEKDE